MDKHCTLRISYLSLSSLVGSRPQVVQRLAFLIFRMRSRARTGLKSKRKTGNSFQAWRSAARGSRLVTILEFGMILRDVAGSSSETAGLCISSNKSAKCQGSFFTVLHMQRGKEEGEKKPHAALRQGRKEANWSTILRCACQGSNAWDVFLCSPLGSPLKEPVPQTADTCSSSSSSAPAKPCGWKGARRGSASLGLCHCGLLPGRLAVAAGGVWPGAGASVGRATMRDRCRATL